MIEKLRIIIVNLLETIKSYIMPKQILIPHPDNKKTSFIVEKAISMFRSSNGLLPYVSNLQLESIAAEHSYEMAKQNRLLYDMKGVKIHFTLKSKGINCKNAFVMPSYTPHENDPDIFLRNITSNTIYRNLILSNNFFYIGVSVFNNYCTVIITSKF